EGQRFALLYRMIAVLLPVVKVRVPKRVRAHQTVIAHVPVRRVPEAQGTVHDGEAAYVRTFDGAGIIAPYCRLAPGRRAAGRARSRSNRARAAAFAQRIGDSHGNDAAFLRVAKRHIAIRREELDIHVEQTMGSDNLIGVKAKR